MARGGEIYVCEGGWEEMIAEYVLIEQIIAVVAVFVIAIGAAIILLKKPKGPEIKYKYELYGYAYKTIWHLMKMIIRRQICSLKGHPKAKFYAATCIEALPDKMNANIGVTFVCPSCYKSWAGNVKAGL